MGLRIPAPRLAAVALGLLLSTAVRAELFRVGFYNAPPLMDPLHQRGVYLDLLRAIGERTGDRFEIAYYPITRLQRLFEAGQLDLEPGVNPVWRQDSPVPGVYTRPFAHLDQVLLFRPGHYVEVTGADSLAGRRIGTIRGYRYPGFMDGFAQGRLERVDVTDEPQLLELLEKGRVDQIFIDRVVQGHWARQDPSRQRYRTSDTLLSIEIMLRLHPSRADSLARLNRALVELQTEGRIAALFARYRY